MKRSFCIIIILFISSIMLCAQVGNKSIIEDLNADKLGEGKVRIMQDESISKILGARYIAPAVNLKHLEGDDYEGTTINEDTKNYVRVRGWKVQVFSGNDQAKSKQEAELRRNKVRSAFPDLEAVLTYEAPTWRLRVGNFTSREMAKQQLAEMKHILPSLAKEMYIVQDVVKKVTH